MPTCQKFFDQLAECLLASKCVKEHGEKPSDCLGLLLRAKVYTQQHKEVEALGDTGKEILADKPSERAPLECLQAQQAYSECKISLMNPRFRLRGPYGS
ncbi:hypothetical protein HDV03_002300 [Kappamyces sp. JEL0829]|nr:hypothetical protein HDV03_002300 [Kappamyces sp. JEL0829]KAJ3330914.1 hypothetical protein HDU91_003473 [Kappamyces sp. JEL0680]